MIIEKLLALIKQNESDITKWMVEKENLIQAPIYCSIDLRNSGYKIAPVDTNLFPAGFNNLSQKGKERARSALNKYLDKYYPNTKKILLVPENHTRNLHYFDNLLVIKEIIEPHRECRFGSVIEDITEDLEFTSEKGKKIVIERIVGSGLPNYFPDLIINNNDLSDGIGEFLQDTQIPIIPELKRGWFNRTKTNHFNSYNKLASEFAALFNFDIFDITTMHKNCSEIDFKTHQGIDCLATETTKLLFLLDEQYKARNIPLEPYVFIKANKGTYGMGITSVRSSEELLAMNKKLRNKVNVIKGGVQNSEIIIQEGVKTMDRIEGFAAEPMIYMVGGEVVDIIYRYNEEHNEYANLNSIGMRFKQVELEEDKNFRVYNLVTKLAGIASQLE